MRTEVEGSWRQTKHEANSWMGNCSSLCRFRFQSHSNHRPIAQTVIPSGVTRPFSSAPPLGAAGERSRMDPASISISPRLNRRSSRPRRRDHGKRTTATKIHVKGARCRCHPEWRDFAPEGSQPRFKQNQTCRASPPQLVRRNTNRCTIITFGSNASNSICDNLPRFVSLHR
jgi:hypothetical protein